YALNRLDYAASRTTELYEHPFTVRKSIRDANLYFTKMEYKLKNAVLAKESGAVNADLKEMHDYEKEFNNNMEVVRERFLGKQSHVDDIYRVYEEWKVLRDRVIAADKVNNHDVAFRLMDSIDTNQLPAMEKEMAEVFTFSDNRAAQFVKESQQT